MQIFHRIRCLVVTYPCTIPAHTHVEMVKREHPEIDLTVDQHDGEPVAQRARLEEPDHLLLSLIHI